MSIILTQDGDRLRVEWPRQPGKVRFAKAVQLHEGSTYLGDGVRRCAVTPPFTLIGETSS